MSKPSNPSEIARETLTTLATRKLAPTPENYAQMYREIGGEPAPAEDVGATDQQRPACSRLVGSDTRLAAPTGDTAQRHHHHPQERRTGNRTESLLQGSGSIVREIAGTVALLVHRTDQLPAPTNWLPTVMPPLRPPPHCATRRNVAAASPGQAEQPGVW